MTTIRNAMETRDPIKISATSTRSGSWKTQWRQWIRVNEAKRGISKMISKNYSLDPVLSIQRGTILECINLRKSLQECQMEEDKKKKHKQYDKDNDRDGTMGFQQPTNMVNMIYGGDSSFYKRI